jgi:ATP-dependent DNA helicase RecQ
MSRHGVAMASPSSFPAPRGSLDEARATLRAVFGYPDFRPPQIRAVEAVLSGRDALIVLPTGGGKSLCYQVPALVRDGLTVVVSPLISLMKDQVETLQRKGVAAAFINSTLPAAAVADCMARARDGTIRLLYLAPERLEAERTLAQLAAIGVAMLAVDEAHCISEWGHDFRPSYRRLDRVRTRLGAPQTVALTATATPSVRRDIARQLALRTPEEVVAGFDRTNLTYHVVTARGVTEKDGLTADWLRRSDGTSIVYTPTRNAVERVTAMLVRQRLPAIAYHGGLDDAHRQRAQEAFMEERARIIVATSAFGMGIDKPDVRLVVHHAMPGSLEAYYQEAGRAGRDGKPGTCALVYAAIDRGTHEYFIAGANPRRMVVEQVWRLLREAAATTGVAWLSEEDLVRRVGRLSDAREVGASLRVLRASGACAPVPAARRAVWVRLLARPARIRQELTEARTPERALLRALWRAAGPQLERGAIVDVDRLPGARYSNTLVVPLLERLAAQQFVLWTRAAGGFRLARNFTDPAWLPVDWDALARRRRTEVDRLDAMEEYARTHHCRRAYVLRYFGDRAARPHCGACDRCLDSTGQTPPRRSGRSRQRS